MVSDDDNMFHILPVSDPVAVTDGMAWQDAAHTDVQHAAIGGADLYQSDAGDLSHGYQTLENGVVVIDDFDARQGDVIDLSSVLGNKDALSGAIEDFVFKTEINGNTVVSVDVNGSGDANNAIPIAVLSGVTGVNLNDVIVTNHETV